MGFFYANMSLAGYKLRNTKWVISFVVLMLLFLCVYIGIGPVLKRFLDIGYDPRILVWKDCINIIRDFPLFGSGLGTFEYVYPLYKLNVTVAVDYNFAHNDYIQFIVETGVLGLVAIISALYLFIKDTYSYMRTNLNNNDSFRYFVTLGAFTGVFSILAHSFVDFNLHIPSNAVYFTTLIGIIYAVNGRDYQNSSGTGSIRYMRKKFIRNEYRVDD